MAARHDQRPEQTVPAPEKVKKRDDRDGWSSERHRDPPEKPLMAAAVNDRGVDEVTR